MEVYSLCNQENLICLFTVQRTHVNLHNRTKRIGGDPELEFFLCYKEAASFEKSLFDGIYQNVMQINKKLVGRMYSGVQKVSKQYLVMTGLCKKQLRKSLFPGCEENTRQGGKNNFVSKMYIDN